MKRVLVALSIGLSCVSGTALASAELAKAKNCLACHATDKKVVGPSYQEVAAKYSKDKDAQGKLAKKIREGGVGAWGQIPMPANPQVSEAEAQTLAFLEQWVPKGKSPICGNSICQDRRFLYRHMPQLEAYFHYRNLDVSTVKELAARWAPKVRDGVKKSSSHLALDDIRDSIAELKHYREHFFNI